MVEGGGGGYSVNCWLTKKIFPAKKMSEKLQVEIKITFKKMAKRGEGELLAVLEGIVNDREELLAVLEGVVDDQEEILAVLEGVVDNQEELLAVLEGVVDNQEKLLAVLEGWWMI